MCNFTESETKIAILFNMIPIWEIWIFVRWEHHKQHDRTELQHISIKPCNPLPFILPLVIYACYNPFPTCALPLNDSSTGSDDQAFSPSDWVESLALGWTHIRWVICEWTQPLRVYNPQTLSHLATGHGKQSNKNSANFFIVAPRWMAWVKYLSSCFLMAVCLECKIMKKKN